MGIEGLHYLIEEQGGHMTETDGGNSAEEQDTGQEVEQTPAEDSPPQPVERPNEEEDSPPQPVDDPNLPEDGDPDDFEEEPVEEADFESKISTRHDDTMDDLEKAEEPNDLSEVDKEFEDDESEA